MRSPLYTKLRKKKQRKVRMLVAKMMTRSGQYCASLPELMMLPSRSFAVVAVVTGFQQKAVSSSMFSL